MLDLSIVCVASKTTYALYIYGEERYITERTRKEWVQHKWQGRKMNGARRGIAKAILEQYKPATAEEMQGVLRDIFGPMFEAMLQGEMDSHLGYGSNDRGAKSTSNRRNGYTDKTVKSSIR